jgi:hypothetical protein
MKVLVNITHVEVFLASLLPRNACLMKDRQDYERLPSMRMASRLSRFIIAIFGAIICLSTNAEIKSALQSHELVDGFKSVRRELAAIGTYSFDCTGAVQTWCYFTLLCLILALDLV